MTASPPLSAVAFPPELWLDIRQAAVAIGDAAFHELDAAGDVPPAHRAVIQQALPLGVQLFADRTSGDLGDGGFGPFRRWGSEHHRIGGELADALTMVRRAAVLLWRRVVRLPVVKRLDQTQTAALGAMMLTHTDCAAVAVTAGYGESEAVASRLQRGQRSRVHQLLLSESPDQEHLENAADAADWPLPERVVVAITPAVGLSGQDETSAPGRVLVEERDGLVVMITREDDATAQWLGRAVRALDLPRPVVCGPGVPPSAALVSLRRAQAGLERVSPELQQEIIFADEHLLDLVLRADPALAHGLATRLLAPLEALDDVTRDRMLETLRAWLDRPDRPQAIADELIVHVQTVRYRLRQLRKLFGDVLDDPERRVDLAIAVRLRTTEGAR